MCLGAALSVVCLASQARDEYYALKWIGTVTMTNAAGELVTKEYTHKDIVEAVAANEGLDPDDLIFVYRADRRDSVVVLKTNNIYVSVFIADVLQMEYFYDDLSNRAKTVTDRQAYLHEEIRSASLGEAFGIEKVRYDPSRTKRIRFFFSGTFGFLTPNDGAHYKGKFATGKLIYRAPG